MGLVRLYIKGISYSQTHSGAYALILSEEGTERKLPIIIGGFEAQSIAIALEKEIQPPRPLTHDLFKNFFDVFKVQLKEVLIHKLVDGVFYSSLVCEREGEDVVIDARTSDAVALALRAEAPIFTYTNILDKAGIYLEGESVEEEEQVPDTHEMIISDEELTGVGKSVSSGKFTNLSMDELRKMLAEAVKNEDYETAVKVRDEIEKRSK